MTPIYVLITDEDRLYEELGPCGPLPASFGQLLFVGEDDYEVRSVSWKLYVEERGEGELHQTIVVQRLSRTPGACK